MTPTVTQASKCKVLIANRGEIARRVIHTCTLLGLETLAIYTEVDALSPHVREATDAAYLGPNPRDYTDAAKLLKIALERGCTAVHPGYGFLSENEAFCVACGEAGIVWLGPTAHTMQSFSLKHVARALAQDAGVPVLSGSGLLTSSQEAMEAAKKVGYPVLLKATGGGGGMGIFICNSPEDIQRQFEVSQHQGQAFFGNSGVFLEKYIQAAHHIEVQIFGDGIGGCIHLGERECSIQRRHQKVLEESPSPLVDEELRAKLTGAAVALGQASKYRSAGTVEFLVDEDTKEFFFLEVNTRLQVEHGITELVHGGIDIVQAQLELQVPSLTPAGGPQAVLAALAAAPRGGHSIEVRINGEDPAHGFQPCPGLLGHVHFPPCSDKPAPGDGDGNGNGKPVVRVDSWVETGTEVSPHYDSLLAKLMVWAPTREEAIETMATALFETALQGVPNNVEFLRTLVADARFRQGKTTTRFLETFTFSPNVIEVVTAGMQSSVQDWPGRIHYWHVGVPPSGPMDSLAHRLANALVGNDDRAAALEFSLMGPTLKFHSPRLVALCGATFKATLDNQPVTWWSSFRVAAGQTLAIEGVDPVTGVRGYLAVSGGVDVPEYLGSRSTFPSGKFGGYQGRYLRPGDSLPLGKPQAGAAEPHPTVLPLPLVPVGASRQAGTSWEVGVLPGPHADPDYITASYMADGFYTSPWRVHYNSNRLGVRLVGPKPDWVRSDGGEGGSHPSNVHDHVYAIGAINFTGDHPVVLTLDGPSLGGFVCPATIVSSELWKIGQVRPDDTILFKKLSLEEAYEKLVHRDEVIKAVYGLACGSIKDAASALEAVEKATQARIAAVPAMPETKPLLHIMPRTESHPGAEYRLAGDRYLQIDYGPMELDLTLRVRVHSLEAWLRAANLDGLVETSPGVRSCMIEYDARRLPLPTLLAALLKAETELPDAHNAILPSRVLHLPMAFDERWTHDAIAKYMRSIRPHAPYLPSNIEYMAANNGLPPGPEGKEAVRSTLFDASYLVLGLGDVYLGAPCAVPMDPRHRLVTTKYNPARTFTAEGTVGIGGSYMCVYPMDSPGGYQLVGRTLPIWNTFARAGPFTPDKPWLLRFFDQVRFFQVSEDELEDMRERFTSGRYNIQIDQVSFDLKAYNAMVARLEPEVEEIRARQRTAMAQQLQLEAESLKQLAETGEADGYKAEEDEEDDSVFDKPGLVKIVAPFSANVWEVRVEVGQQVAAGQTMMVLEAMKMESPVTAPVTGKVMVVRAKVSQVTAAGTLLAVIQVDP